MFQLQTQTWALRIRTQKAIDGLEDVIEEHSFDPDVIVIVLHMAGAANAATQMGVNRRGCMCGQRYMVCTRKRGRLEEAGNSCAARRIGLQYVYGVRIQYPRIRLLVLAHAVDVAEVQEAITIGVSGYLLLGSSLEGLETSIRLVHSSKLTLSSEIAEALRTGD